MQRSGSQKALLVLSIIELICGIIVLALGVMTLIGGGIVAGELGSELGAEAGEVAGGITGVIGGVSVFAGLLSVLAGVFGIRAANDNQKIMIVWVFVLIVAIVNIISIVMAIINGTFGTSAFSLIASLLFSLLMFWICNNIKKQAGK